MNHEEEPMQSTGIMQVMILILVNWSRNKNLGTLSVQKSLLQLHKTNTVKLIQNKTQ